jgi:hypothetical protein
VLAAAVGFCFAYLAFNPPAAIAAQTSGYHELLDVQAWFRRAYGFGAAICAVAVAAWVVIETGRWRPRAAAFVWGLGLLALGEMAATAWGEDPQADASLYYPPVLALATPARQDRVWPWYCLPPNLAMVPGLRDVRGYDAVDPARPVRLVQIASDPNFPPSPTPARTQWATPRTDLPLLSAMSVRYFIGRGKPPTGLPDVVYNANDYWIAENRSALPRAYVPRRAEVVNDEAERLRRMSGREFAPADIVYLESSGPVVPGPFDADVAIAQDEPTVVRLDVNARTPSVVVLADHWYAGWTARLNGKPVPILRANHAFRAVEVPAGKSSVEFRYEPASFRTGVWLAMIAVAAQGCWLVAGALRRRRGKPRGN